MTEVGTNTQLQRSLQQAPRLSAEVEAFVPGSTSPSYPSSSMTAMYYNSSSHHQQQQHHHHHAPQPIHHHPHQHHPHPHHQQAPVIPGVIPQPPPSQVQGMVPEAAAMSRLKPPPPPPPSQPQGGGGGGGGSGMQYETTNGAVATMNGKKVPLTELPRYITTCYPFVQDSSTGAAPATETWMAYPNSSQQPNQPQQQPPQQQHQHPPLPPTSQHPMGHQQPPQPTAMYPPPPTAGHQVPGTHVPQQNQEYFPVHPGYNQVPHQTPSPAAPTGPHYQQHGAYQHGSHYQPHPAGTAPSPHHPPHHHHHTQSPTPVPMVSQPSMPAGGVPAPHSPFAPPPMMTPHSQSPSPYPFHPPTPPHGAATPPHGAATPGGYDAMQSSQSPVPTYDQYRYGAYPGPHVKVRGQKPMNKDHRYPGGQRIRGREQYQAYIPPPADIPKPKAKTVVFAEACAQTDFPEAIANKPLSDKTSNLASRSKAKTRKKSQGNQTGRDTSSSSDSEVENTPHDSDSGYYSPLHAQQNGTNSVSSYSTQTGKPTYSNVAMNTRSSPHHESSNMEQHAFTQKPPMGPGPQGPVLVPAGIPPRGRFTPVQPGMPSFRPPVMPMSYASMLTKPRTALPPPPQMGNVAYQQRPPNVFPTQPPPTYRNMAVSPAPMLHQQQHQQQQQQQRRMQSPVPAPSQKPPATPEDTPKKRKQKRSKGRKDGEVEAEKPKMVNAATYAKPPQIQDQEEYPGLPMGVPARNAFGAGTGGRPISYSSAVQQRPPVHQVNDSSSEEEDEEDGGGRDSGSVIKPEELLSPANVMSTIKEGKNARKRRKKAIMATQAAAKEYSEITEEQRQLHENMKKQGKRTKMPIEFDLGDMLAALEKQQQEIRAKQQQQQQLLQRGPGSRNVQFAPTVATTMSPFPKPRVVKEVAPRGHNPLDTAAPVKRGKERELPAKKKPSALKRVILKEREEKKRLRTLEESRLSDEEPTGEDEDEDEEEDEEEEEGEEEEGEEEEEEGEEGEEEEVEGEEEEEEEEEEVEEVEEKTNDHHTTVASSDVGLSQGLSQGFSQGFTYGFSHGFSQGLSQDAPSDRGSFPGFNASQSDLSPLSQMSPLSMSPLSPGSPLSSGFSSPATGMGRSNPTQVATKIHSRRFREYCNQVLDKDIDACCTTLLQTLVKFQDRQYHKDPAKAKMKRRLVMGLREVTKHLKLKKIKCVVVSPNLERIQSKGGLDEAMDRISALASEQNVPLIFALGRKALGRAVNKVVPVSVVGIFNYDGAEDTYKQLLDLSTRARNAYADMVRKFQQELEAANAASAARMAKHRHHMGHNRNLSGCSAISFSSVISEPISENYPNPEPEVDSQGREIEPEAPTTPTYTPQGGGSDSGQHPGAPMRSLSFTGTGSVISNSTDDTIHKEEKDGGSSSAGKDYGMSETSSRTLTAGEGEQDLEVGSREDIGRVELEELEAGLDDQDHDEEDEEEEEEEDDEDAEVIKANILLPEDGAPEKRVADWVAEAQQCIESLTVDDDSGEDAADTKKEPAEDKKEDKPGDAVTSPEQVGKIVTSSEV